MTRPPGQSASAWPVRASCSPWAAAARRNARARSSAEPHAVSPSTRPGNRAVTSCTSHPLPSGSEDDGYEPYVPRSGSGPGSCGSEPGDRHA
jgi:hypothetical protein